MTFMYKAAIKFNGTETPQKVRGEVEASTKEAAITKAKADALKGCSKFWKITSFSIKPS